MVRHCLLGIAVLMLASPALAQQSASAESAEQTAAAAAESTPSDMTSPRAKLDVLIAKHAKQNGIPEALVRRVIVRESRYNPRAIGKGGALGLMQIKHATARGLGYSGPASGLLDAETNLTYAVRYLAGAYRAAEGNADRAVAYFAKGYYYVTKRKALHAYASAVPPAAPTAAAEPAKSAEQPADDATEPQAEPVARPQSEGLF